ncbi:MAG TPA: CHASE3 domain-containing protein [Gaiellaceae bacterium]|nr:CHASE3 domain-containing protein [Gaiellaceae bacterium]
MSTPEEKLEHQLPTSGRRRLASDTQVLIGVGSLLALLALAVGVAVFLIVSLEEDASDLSQRHVQYAAQVHQAALLAKSMANHQRGFLLSSDPQYLAQIESDAADARAAFALSRSHAVGAAQRRAVERARAGFERWIRALRADIAAYRAGDRERAIQASLGSTRAIRKGYERALAHAYLLGVRSISRETNALSASATRDVTALLVYLAVALVIGAGIAFWVVRMILKPAFVLSRNAIEVLTRGRVLVAEDERGSHYGVAVEVPVEVVNALAESALDAQEALRPGGEPQGREA